MKRSVNYLGQLRAYSLIDYMLMLVAAGASPNLPQFWSAVGYWIGFLAHLESVHHDKGREPVPNMASWFFWLYAVMVWKNDDVGFLFIALSLVYAWKKHKPWGLVSPFVRGLQTLVMVGGIGGYDHSFPWIAAILTAVRNWLGDIRDATEDACGMSENARECTYTWPVNFGWKSRPFIHFLGVYSTTIVWWLFAEKLSWRLLLSMLLIETSTYWLTPRPSNKNAAEWLRNKILKFRR